MGQARRRGTYKQRKDKAVVLQAERQRIEDHEAALRDAAMTPAQKKTVDEQSPFMGSDDGTDNRYGPLTAKINERYTYE